MISQTIGALPYLQSEAYVNLAGNETAAGDRSDLFGNATSSLQNVAASPAFQQAKAGNDYLGPVTYANGVPTVTFASPVKDENSQTIGVITGVAELGELQGIVASATIGNTGYLYLVDQDGALMAAGGALTGDIGSSTVSRRPWCKKWSVAFRRLRPRRKCATKTHPARAWWRPENRLARTDRIGGSSPMAGVRGGRGHQRIAPARRDHAARRFRICGVALDHPRAHHCAPDKTTGRRYGARGEGKVQRRGQHHDCETNWKSSAIRLTTW